MREEQRKAYESVAEGVIIVNINDQGRIEVINRAARMILIKDEKLQRNNEIDILSSELGTEMIS